MPGEQSSIDRGTATPRAKQTAAFMSGVRILACYATAGAPSSQPLRSRPLDNAMDIGHASATYPPPLRHLRYLMRLIGHRRLSSPCPTSP
ncbi:protein of unknown function [Paraburkholderia dioscoreae]|uniref:Uncharacterized protein n=1 Tax=Paraburkholderia dioscoreae TaxID=2604047 RepID=A0A5Q4ZNI9_9BURK|nr:protein of unknown function [Paraburkholderia dioscoreae]